MSRAWFYLSLVTLLLGAACIIAGAIMRARRRAEREYEGETKAKVVDLLLREDPLPSGGFRNKYYPVFQFYAGGKLCEKIYPFGAYPAAWTIGQSVDLEYDPADPSNFRIREPDLRQVLPTVLYMGGYVLVVIGIILFLFYALRKS